MCVVDMLVISRALLLVTWIILTVVFWSLASKSCESEDRKAKLNASLKIVEDVDESVSSLYEA